MNIDIFMEVSGLTFDPPTLIKITQEENELSRCLTTHLALERFLEAWICSYSEIPDLFQEIEKEEKKDKVKFSMIFSGKAKLAQRMGLPMEAYQAIDQLNAIRNKYAHRYDYQWTSLKEKKELISKVDEIDFDGLKLSSKEYKIAIRDADDKEIIHTLNSDECPPSICYFAISYALMQACLFYLTNKLPITGTTRPTDSVEKRFIKLLSQNNT